MPKNNKIGARARARRDRVLSKKLRFSGKHDCIKRKSTISLSSCPIDSGETDDGRDFRHNIAALLFCGKREYIVTCAMPLNGWVTTSYIVDILGLTRTVFTCSAVSACLNNLYLKMLVTRKPSIATDASYGYQYSINTDISPDKLPMFQEVCQRFEKMGI